MQVHEKFLIGDVLASFVVTPPPDNETLFVGLWDVQGIGRVPAGTIDPVRQDQPMSKETHGD
jgi:hypothetical protein